MSSIKSDIKQLKELILESAMRGKLVPQNLNDEPASVLLEKMKAEKSKLNREGKMKYDKKFSEIKPEEIPFDIPNSWKWVRLGEVVEINLGLTHTPKYVDKGIPFLSVKDISKGRIDFLHSKFITQQEFDSMPKGCKPQKNDILFGRVGTLGVPSVLEENIKFGLFVSAGYLRVDSKYLYNYFVKSFVQSGLFKQYIKDNVKGAAQKNLNTGWLSLFLIPFPPKNEQLRIVQKINELMELCDEIDQSGISLEDKLKELKSAILQSAIQGKLVPQDSSDEPASILLEKIQAEKSKLVKEGKKKKEKLLSKIKLEEIPFEIPSSWKWVRLGDLIENINGKAFKPSEWNESGIPIIRIQNLNNINAKYNYCRITVPEKYYVSTGDLLVGWSGTPGTSFGAYIWKGGKAVLNQHIFNSKPYDSNISKEFIQILINARLDEMISKAHGGAGLRHITKEKFDNMPLPLAPLKEQRRIVHKIDEQMKLISQFKQKLNQTKDLIKT